MRFLRHGHHGPLCPARACPHMHASCHTGWHDMAGAAIRCKKYAPRNRKTHHAPYAIPTGRKTCQISSGRPRSSAASSRVIHARHRPARHMPARHRPIPVPTPAITTIVTAYMFIAVSTIRVDGAIVGGGCDQKMAGMLLLCSAARQKNGTGNSDRGGKETPGIWSLPRMRIGDVITRLHHHVEHHVTEHRRQQHRTDHKDIPHAPVCQHAGQRKSPAAVCPIPRRCPLMRHRPAR